MPITAKKIQRAMAEAAILCSAEGIKDPTVIRQRKLAARRNAVNRARDEEIIDRVEAQDAQR